MGTADPGAVRTGRVHGLVGGPLDVAARWAAARLRSAGPVVGLPASPSPTPTAHPTHRPSDARSTREPEGVDREASGVGDVQAVQGDLAAGIEFWAAHYGVSAGDLEGIAWCESTFGQDTDAYAPGALHQGAYQFEHQTWLGTPPGQRGESAYNDWYASEAAAWMLAQGRRGEWPGC